MWLSQVLIAATRILVGASPRGLVPSNADAQRIYFANHSSHLDTLALWSALPPHLRGNTRPVAAADYWDKGGLRRFVVLRGLNAILLDRNRTDPSHDPLQPVKESLKRGESLIFFPEGTRMLQPLPGPFRSGLYYLATHFPLVELIPVYLRNMHRSMPRGTLFPVPLICTVHFGAPLVRADGEGKAAFLKRARDAVVALA